MYLFWWNFRALRCLRARAINLIPCCPGRRKDAKATLSIVFRKDGMRIACGLGIICALILGAAGLSAGRREHYADRHGSVFDRSVFARRELPAHDGGGAPRYARPTGLDAAVSRCCCGRFAYARRHFLLRGASLVAVDRSFRYMGTLTEGDRCRMIEDRA